MSALLTAAEDYLALRRALGYKLTAHGRLLPQFVAFLEQREASLITTSLALQWATQPADASVVWWHQRLAIVRGFARHLQPFDSRHEAPAGGLFAGQGPPRGALPVLRSGDRGADAGRSPGPLAASAATCEMLIGLLAV